MKILFPTRDVDSGEGGELKEEYVIYIAGVENIQGVSKNYKILKFPENYYFIKVSQKCINV